MEKRKRFRAFFLICALVVAAVIFAFSSQPGSRSGDTSEAASSALVGVLRPFLPELSDNELDELIYTCNVIMRKLAHAFIFALLGAFCASFALTFHGNTAVLAISGWLAAVLYAAGDELHQEFVPDRGPSLLDVALDGSGAALGAAVAALICVALSLRRERRS